MHDEVEKEAEGTGMLLATRGGWESCSLRCWGNRGLRVGEKFGREPRESVSHAGDNVWCEVGCVGLELRGVA